MLVAIVEARLFWREGRKGSRSRGTTPAEMDRAGKGASRPLRRHSLGRASAYRRLLCVQRTG